MKFLRRSDPHDDLTEDNIALEKLSLPVGLEDGRVPYIFDHFLYGASGILLLAIIWGSLAEIREFASASGRVIPSSFVKSVHHLEGGQIEAVNVREGQIVEKGQALMALRPVAAQSDLGQLEVRRNHLELKMRRLDALIRGKTPQYQNIQDDDLKSRENEIFNRERRRLDKELKAIEARVQQRKVEVASLIRELANQKRQVDIQSEKLDIRARLLKSGYTSRRAFLDAEGELEKAKGLVISIHGKLGSAKGQLAEAKHEYQKVLSAALAKYSEDYSAAAGEALELEQNMRKHRDKIERLQIAAPVRGVIQELLHKAPGEVVRPGELVAKIVPVDEEVVAEVNVEPKDIGHIKLGDNAEIKISTFDPNVYGVLKGTVEHLSATTFQDDPNSPPYFKAVIKLEKGFFGSAERPVSILPGMEVQADIITGAKSLVRYFLKPVYRSLHSAFSER